MRLRAVNNGGRKAIDSLCTPGMGKSYRSIRLSLAVLQVRWSTLQKVEGENPMANDPIMLSAIVGACTSFVLVVLFNLVRESVHQRREAARKPEIWD